MTKTMMIKYFINSFFLVLLVLPLGAVAEDNGDLGFIDGVWQIYGLPHYQSEPAPEPGKFFSLHYEQKSGVLVLVDLPSVEQGHPVLMASYIGTKSPNNTIALGIDNSFLLDTVEFDTDIAKVKGIVKHRFWVIFTSDTEAVVITEYASPMADGAPPAWWIRKIFKQEAQH
jgi:hypothetical protein